MTRPPSHRPRSQAIQQQLAGSWDGDESNKRVMAPPADHSLQQSAVPNACCASVTRLHGQEASMPGQWAASQRQP